jgi:hypothetical protein
MIRQVGSMLGRGRRYYRTTITTARWNTVQSFRCCEENWDLWCRGLLGDVLVLHKRSSCHEPYDTFQLYIFNRTYWKVVSRCILSVYERTKLKLA